MSVKSQSKIEMVDDVSHTNSHDKSLASPQENDDLNFVVRIGAYTFRIYKPLIPLKIVLFVWYGAASFLAPFLSVYLKQRGITLGEISLFYTLSPIVQVLGSLLSGLLADKLGRSKPILVANLILVFLFLGGLMLVPKLQHDDNCDHPTINLKCHPQQFDRLVTKARCDKVEEVIEAKYCNVQCPENVTEYCDSLGHQNLICELLTGPSAISNFSLSLTVSGSSRIREDRCYYNVSHILHHNDTFSWCSVPHKMNCRISCTVHKGLTCGDDKRSLYLMLTMVLFILFSTCYSNSFRFMDVASMALVKEHHSDFGRERFFSVAGMLVISPLAGLLADVTTPEGSERNYASAFYLFFALIIGLGFIIIYQLDVRITEPGQKMWSKSLGLVKNPDVLSFAIVLLTLGMAFSFTKNFMFWYLEGLHASSLLIGLIPAFSALYGLPFLATSAWWVRRVGPTRIFVLGLLGYLLNCLGYSFLLDPWWSLLLEATNILTYHLLWVAVIENSHQLAPAGLTATVIAMAGSLHYQIGKACGALVGGQIMDVFGGRVAFRVMGVICLVCAIFYAGYLYIRSWILRKREKMQPT